MNKKLKETMLGGVTQNPAFVLVLGMCPMLATTKSMESAFWMGVGVVFVLIMSNLIISLLRNVIPGKVRLPSYIMIIATFVTIVKMVMKKYIPDMYNTLGTFIALIVVNCVIFGRADGFAKSNNPGLAVIDGISMGLGYMFGLMLVSMVREVLALGTLFNIKLWDGAEFSISFFGKEAGAFVTLALLMAGFTAVYKAVTAKKKAPHSEPAAEIPSSEVTQ